MKKRIRKVKSYDAILECYVILFEIGSLNLD